MTRKKHRKKQMKPGEKVGLTLTQAERTLLLNAMHGVTEEIRDVIRATPTAQPVMLTLDDLNDLEGHVAAEANHTKDKKLRQRLDAISEKIQKHSQPPRRRAGSDRKPRHDRLPRPVR